MKRHLAAGFVVCSIFVMANVVAAGVCRVLGDIAQATVARDDFLVWLAIGGVAVGSALAFIGGAMPAGMKFLRWIR
tara:strand:- start:48247 stop:48474 length:228 start_codon:yes stop_codon:yes gene_type:complete